MGRLLTLILSLVVISVAVYFYVRGSIDSTGSHGVSRPRQQLDHVNEEVHRAEEEAQKRADDALRKSAN